MKSFSEYVADDTHGHPSYTSHLGCFTRYVQQCAKDGDSEAVTFVFDSSLHDEYEQGIIRRMARKGYSSAGLIVDENIDQVTNDVLDQVRDVSTAKRKNDAKDSTSKKLKTKLSAANTMTKPSTTDIKTEKSGTADAKKKKSGTADIKTKKSSTTDPGPSDSTVARRCLRYEGFDETLFMRLKSGRYVEKILIDANLTSEATFKTRSFTIDFNCDFTMSLFTQDEWKELSDFNKFVLPDLPATTVRYAVNLGKALETLNLREMKNIEMPTDEED
ncbi:hypothetical protein BGZ65_010944, partial [Modicella reniformis]